MELELEALKQENEVDASSGAKQEDEGEQFATPVSRKKKTPNAPASSSRRTSSRKPKPASVRSPVVTRSSVKKPSSTKPGTRSSTKKLPNRARSSTKKLPSHDQAPLSAKPAARPTPSNSPNPFMANSPDSQDSAELAAFNPRNLEEEQRLNDMMDRSLVLGEEEEDVNEVSTLGTQETELSMHAASQLTENSRSVLDVMFNGFESYLNSQRG